MINAGLGSQRRKILSEHNLLLSPIQSAPRTACLEENTTWDLVKDVETLREHLKIEKWHVFGGSWVSKSLHFQVVLLLRPVYIGVHAFSCICSSESILSRLEAGTNLDMKSHPERVKSLTLRGIFTLRRRYVKGGLTTSIWDIFINFMQRA